MAKKNNISGLISVIEAKTLENYYKSEFYNPLNKMKSNDYPGYSGAVRDIWFSIEELKNYIEYVEEYAAKKNYSGLGLRVYLGAKDEKGIDNLDYPRQTVFFVPTAKTNQAGKLTNTNLTGVERLNYGNAGHPDSDSDLGMN